MEFENYIKPMLNFAEFIAYFTIGTLMVASFLTTIIFAVKKLRTIKLAFFNKMCNKAEKKMPFNNLK